MTALEKFLASFEKEIVTSGHARKLILFTDTRAKHEQIEAHLRQTSIPSVVMRARELEKINTFRNLENGLFVVNTAFAEGWRVDANQTAFYEVSFGDNDRPRFVQMEKRARFNVYPSALIYEDKPRSFPDWLLQESELWLKDDSGAASRSEK